MIIFMDKYSIGKRHLTNLKYKDAILNFQKAIKKKEIKIRNMFLQI